MTSRRRTRKRTRLPVLLLPGGDSRPSRETAVVGCRSRTAPASDPGLLARRLASTVSPSNSTLVSSAKGAGGRTESLRSPTLGGGRLTPPPLCAAEYEEGDTDPE